MHVIVVGSRNIRIRNGNLDARGKLNHENFMLIHYHILYPIQYSTEGTRVFKYVDVRKLSNKGYKK